MTTKTGRTGTTGPVQQVELVCDLEVRRGTGTPKDRDEVNRREVCECDGCVCDLDVIGSPSRLMLIRKISVFVRVLSTLGLSCGENTTRR